MARGADTTNMDRVRKKLLLRRRDSMKKERSVLGNRDR
jgi:hypothetical protein